MVAGVSVDWLVAGADAPLQTHSVAARAGGGRTALTSAEVGQLSTLRELVALLNHPQPWTPVSVSTAGASWTAAGGALAERALQRAQEVWDVSTTLDLPPLVGAAFGVEVCLHGLGPDLDGLAYYSPQCKLDKAVTLRAAGGRVNSVTWSKVQNASSVVAEVQAYAILQLRGLAEELERESKIGLLQVAAKRAESDVQEWLAVLARCSQLQDGLAVLELDRVMAVDPADLDDHRRGLKTARQDRIQLIATTTSGLARHMHEVAARADDKALLHPSGPPAIVRSNNTISSSITVL